MQPVAHSSFRLWNLPNEIQKLQKKDLKRRTLSNNQFLFPFSSYDTEFDSCICVVALEAATPSELFNCFFFFFHRENMEVQHRKGPARISKS